MPQVQYNLADFENREPRMRVVKPQIARPARKAKHINLAPVRTAAACVVGLTLVFSVLLSRAQATSLAAEINRKETQLVELQASYDYLSYTMESRASIGAVEEYATGQLGLVKMDKTQIEYVSLQEGNKVERADQGSDFWTAVQEKWQSLMEYLMP